MWKVLCSLGLSLFVMAGCGKDSSTRPVPTVCPDGAVKWVNGHCYEAVLAPGISWDQAEDSCEVRGGHLVTITSTAENAFVFSLVSADSSFWYLDGYGNGLGPWLGGYQLAGSQEPGAGWRWVTDEPFVYTNWETDQPDNAGGAFDQNRLRFFKKGGLIGGRWDDSDPDNPLAHRRGYIFEHD